MMRADAEQWFPSRGVKRAWIAFDVVIAGVLFSLAQRWRPRLAVVAASAVTLDASLTIAQAAAYNVRRASRKRDWLVIAAAIAAPLVASAILWGGLKRREMTRT